MPGYRCLLCTAPSAHNTLCRHCNDDLPRLHGTLPVELPNITRAFAACTYAYPLDELIKAFKFRRDMAAMGAGLALIAESVSSYSLTFDAVIPVPLGPRRYLSRGFNQAALLGRGVAIATGAKLTVGAVRRVADREPQSSLDARARRRNIRGVFQVRKRLDGQRVLIVDDVLSTGATVSELARCCRRAGANGVDVLTLAWNPEH